MIRLFALISILLAYSCSTKRPDGKTPAEVLFKEAQAFVNAERYLLATEKLNLLRSQYPYSFYATHAELLQADILFKQENFVEAAAAYILFRDFHPRSKKMAYVVWKIAESFDKQIPDTFDRDLTPAIEAIKYYEEVIKKYPRSEYIEGAGKKIAHAKKMLIDKEQYVADFYFKTEVYSAARFRYLDILNNIEDQKLKNHSMTRIVSSSLLLDEYQKCINYADKFLPLLNGSQKKAVSATKVNCQTKLNQPQK